MLLCFWAFIVQKCEGRLASDEDLKLSDTLRYYTRDSNAAKNLLYRRLRSLTNYENANKALEKARSKNKEVATVISFKEPQMHCDNVSRFFKDWRQVSVSFCFVMKAEANQQKCCDKFEKISETAREELASLKTRRIQHFRKNLVDLTELELKHAKVWHVNELVN